VFCVLLSFYWSDGDKVVASMSGDGVDSWNGYRRVVEFFDVVEVSIFVAFIPIRWAGHSGGEV
jgi:hypothetical protein